MNWINYEALCGKRSLQSILPYFSLLIYWPPTPLFSFCCYPIFPISSICFKIKKLLFGRLYKHCTSTDVFSVSARNGHTLMRFCLALFLVWRENKMNIFILLLGSFCHLFFLYSPLMALWQIWCFCDFFPLCIWLCFISHLSLFFENTNWPEFTFEHLSQPFNCVTGNMFSV